MPTSAMVELGSSFGVATAAAVFAHWGGYASPASFLAGFRPAVLALAVVAALALPAAALLPARRPAAPGPDPAARLEPTAARS
ncbi:hypothetical protein [Dactylosporangium sp. CA-092794]|uniref:hypothetical protein n=1 Tax=Dactylosporangium sp. CA-092794 TaxID=3239929 RepID=UPI003D930C5F